MDRDYDPDVRYRRLPLPPLPTACPQCQAALLPHKIRKSTWTRRVLIIGVVGTLLWGIGLLWVFPGFGWFSSFGFSRDLKDTVVVLFLLPLFTIIRYYLDAAKVVVLKCGTCSWNREFLAKNRQKFVVEKAADHLAAQPSKKSEEHPVYIIDDGSGVGWNSGFSFQPIHCPECEEELLEPRARRPRWVAFVAVALTFHLIVGSQLLGALYDSSWWPALQGSPRTILFLLVVVVPVAVAGQRIKRAGRVLPYECYKCGWESSFPITENYTFDVADDWE